MFYVNDSVVLSKKTLFLHDIYVTRPLFRLSTIAQKSQQSASRWPVLTFYRIAPCLRGPAPKKRPMISGSKIESADFYLPSRSYRILFKNDFLLFQFRFKPKISSRKLFPSDSSKISPKISPRKKRFRNRKIIRQTTQC